ncbi:double-strand break repair helicase AddA [Novosphingobium sp. M1R2S20]|uniref:DNA 3'-5' helicase n=1 Tax=Novosphingobium rhizovicinum TaxID=3228928 RepID=A0ABV3R7F7_9SPHN
MTGPHPLVGSQMKAVAPQDTVWLSASAGTGKTQVLSSRVLRLLLQPGVEPSQILCLTFTKAGATEMAARINEKLASWVRLGEPELAAELAAIGADVGPQTRQHARTLFAAVLDCPGGGLRIDTIHAFSQWLLAAFPLESGLVPGTRPMEDRERVLLARQVLADLLVTAEKDPVGDPQLLVAVAELSLRMGPDAVQAFLLRCASAREAWLGPGGWQEPMRPNVLRLLGLPSDANADMLAKMCCDDAFDTSALRRCHETLSAWSTETGREGAEAIAAWLAAEPEVRAKALADLYGGLFTKTTGAPKRLANILKRDPDYEDHIGRVSECIARVQQMAAMLQLADRLVPALRLGRAFALAWEDAKRREGLIDFDDQIRQAAALLSRRELSDWIRYKLDRRFDHILVDEAQDTNEAQWDIIFAMAEEFWAGEGQHSDRLRTLFVVGDYKQAIFRFQGTSPENFRRAADRVRLTMRDAAHNATYLAENARPRELQDLGLDRSFRTAQEVLDFVDRALHAIGHDGIGLDRPAERHVGQQRPGYVSLWQPIGAASDELDDEPEEGAETWLSRPDRQLAERIARQVRAWLDPQGSGFRLHKGGERRAAAGDIMVLVRKRKELAGLIVARLHAMGVPVAGVDRLRLGAPLAVKDLVAALRFAAQPLDDLNLANLLVSPLVGWTQDALLEHGYRDPGQRPRRSLWAHLRASVDPLVRDSVVQLSSLLAIADFDPPHVLLQWLLSGPWQGRRKLVARLGVESNDPIDELVNAALAYSAIGTPSIAGFLAWFDAGDGELKREADNAQDLVRVMTVHGSKGLQAPIVILADATGNPDESRERGLDLPDPHDTKRRIPLPPLRKEEKCGRIAEEAQAVKQAEMQEHWRLLYVAMTRAEEALFIGGALGPRDKGAAAPNSWYARLEALFPPEQVVADPLWDSRRDWGSPPEGMAADSAGPAVELPLPEPLPPALLRPPPAEPLPPRPLAPSALGEEAASDPPLLPGAALDAARRGTLMHRLLERLPEMSSEMREEGARQWLVRNAADFSEHEREAMLAATLAIVSEPGWADLFGPSSLAEVPFSAIVGGQVVAGTVDRLLITPEQIRIVDFKTARRPPASLEQVPVATLRQMAAYVAALETVYPGRTVDAAILYTATPQLLALDADVLAPYKPHLAAIE